MLKPQRKTQKGAQSSSVEQSAMKAVTVHGPVPLEVVELLLEVVPLEVVVLLLDAVMSPLDVTVLLLDTAVLPLDAGDDPPKELPVVNGAVPAEETASPAPP